MKKRPSLCKHKENATDSKSNQANLLRTQLISVRSKKIWLYFSLS